MPVRCATMCDLRRENACHGPARSHRESRCDGRGGSVVSLCADLRTYGRPVTADRRKWRRVLHVIRTGRRRGDRGRAGGGLQADRGWPSAGVCRGAGQRPAGTDPDQVGARVPEVRGMPGLHSGEGDRSPRGRPGAAAALHRLRGAVLHRRALQLALARPGPHRRNEVAAAGRGRPPAAQPLFPAGDARCPADRRVLPRAVRE